MVEKVFLRRPDAFGNFAPGIGKDAQIPFAGNFRIELSERARGGVARVGKGFFARRGIFFVKHKKVGFRHVNFAAHFQHFRRVGYLLRQFGNGFQVFGNVFAFTPVAAGGSLYENAVFVSGGKGQTIDFGFTHKGNVRVGI